MKTLAYLRVSTDKQDLKNQKLEILDYARKHELKVEDFIEIEMSSRKTPKQRRIDELLSALNKGDLLIVSELSRLGRSVGQVVTLVDKLIKSKIRIIAIKEGIDIDGKKSMQTKVMVTMFTLFAEIERDLISERTKQGLRAARAKGKLLGRPKGSFGKNKLDGKEQFILDELKYGVAKSAIARKLGVSRTSLVNFIKTRNLGG
jgi:DNA invertase Pin-like site-specific DNA recombinase